MPIETSLLPVFLLAALLVILTPGPDMIFITANTLGGGRKAGVVSMLGVASGVYVHILAATFGLSAIFAASELAYQVVRFAGAAYLAWIGWQFLTRKSSFGRIGAAGPAPLATLYRRGILTNLLNPKAILFVSSFVPQFVVPEIGPVWVQMMTLGVILITLMILVDLPIIWAANRFGMAAGRYRGAGDLLSKIIGSLLISLAVYLAVARRQS